MRLSLARCMFKVPTIISIEAAPHSWILAFLSVARMRQAMRTFADANRYLQVSCVYILYIVGTSSHIGPSVVYRSMMLKIRVLGTEQSLPSPHPNSASSSIPSSGLMDRMASAAT